MKNTHPKTQEPILEYLPEADDRMAVGAELLKALLKWLSEYEEEIETIQIERPQYR